MKKLSCTVLLFAMGVSATVQAAVSQPPPDNPSDPCSPNWHGSPPINPCPKVKGPKGKDKPQRFNGHPGAGQRLYPAPDGKGGPCTKPWTQGPTGYPYCPGDIIE